VCPHTNNTQFQVTNHNWLISIIVQIISACPGAEFYQIYPNTRVFGGSVVSASTLSACESACTSNVDCASYNWKKAGGANSCELLTYQGDSVITDTNWETHLKMKCTGVQTPTSEHLSNDNPQNDRDRNREKIMKYFIGFI